MQPHPVNFKKCLTHFTLVAATTALAFSPVSVPSAQATLRPSDYCSPLNGQWYFQGRPGPTITESDAILWPVDEAGRPGRPIHFTVDMSIYGRPRATGEFIGPNQIRVTFPDDGTFIGTLDGMGNIRWNNGTVWQAMNFAGQWRYGGVPGPIVRQEGRHLTIDMSAYRRPTAWGTLITPNQARVTFPDGGATLVATLVSPSCIRWSNGTEWTK